VLLAVLVAILTTAAIVLMAMPFLLVRHARQQQDATISQALQDAGGTP
jgi:hypothetical protein